MAGIFTLIINTIKGIAVNSFELLLDMAPYLLFGFFFAGILHEFISTEKIAAHLGKKRMSSVFKSALFGIPLPLCSCGVIPPTMTLKKAGASRGSVVSFLIATPTTGVDSIMATYALLGPFFAVYRVIASFTAGIFSGILTNLTDTDKQGTPAESHEPKPDQEQVGLYHRIVRIFRYAFFDLLSEIGKWLVIGILIGGVITYAIPDSFFSETLTSGWQTILLMLVISVPLYVCATGSIPIAAALMLKGLNPGAAFVLLLAGPATNSVSITVVSRFLGKRTTIVYLTSLIISSLALGFGLDALWRAYDLNLAISEHIHDHLLPLWLTVGSTLLLTGLLIANFIRSKRNSESVDETETDSENQTVFSVPDMSCNNCVATVENALKNVKGVETYQVNLSKKVVSVRHSSGVDDQDLYQAVEKAGYRVKDTQ
ncbi:MAG: permease [candidate division KSB1 bacterium]|nr:permease [candidate division KSB1 bacterium]